MPVIPSHLDDGDVFDATRALLERFSRSIDSATFLDDCLDSIVDLLGADRGLILLTPAEGESHPINARAKGRALTRQEREEISRTIIHEAKTEGVPVTWKLAKETTQSIMDLGILTAIAVPLISRGKDESEQTHGVLYADFRDPTRITTKRHLDFMQAAAVLIGAAMQQGHQLIQTREQLREAQSTLRNPVPAPSLDAILAPRSMSHIRRDVLASIQGDSPVLLLGESGCGKTLLATALAETSGRTPIVRATLGASDDMNTITSELFGHLRGAFSGANTVRTGVVEFADGGTLILDEVLNLPMHAQQLLLDFTQFGTFRPLGYAHPNPKHASVRIIAATNGDLEAAVREGRFREDLYYRLAGATIHVPSLRERREEIPGLADGFLERLAHSQKRTSAMRLSLGIRRLFISPQVSWPGNLRQLEAVVRRASERAYLRDPSSAELLREDLTPRDLGLPEFPYSESDEEPPSHREQARSLTERWDQHRQDRNRLEEEERSMIRESLLEHGWVIARAARQLGLSRTGLTSRMSTLRIEREAKPH